MILLEDAIRFPHGWLEPVCLRIILNTASAAVVVVHQIWRIGEDEIDAVRRHLPHDVNAVALHDGIDELFLSCSLCLHDFYLLYGPGVVSQDTLPQGRER